MKDGGKKTFSIAPNNNIKRRKQVRKHLQAIIK
jgi:hypothetical protein